MSQQEQDPINEYEEVKSQNRRRLIGGGALALVAGALIASAISNSSQEEKAPVMAEAPAKAKKPDVLTPPGSPQPANTQAASAEQPENANSRRAAAAFPDENGAVKPVPTLAQGNELPAEKPSIDDRQRHEAREKARAEQAEERDLMLAREREQQRIKAEERKKRLSDN